FDQPQPANRGARDLSRCRSAGQLLAHSRPTHRGPGALHRGARGEVDSAALQRLDRKSTRLNSSHVSISYAVFCLKKKKKIHSKFIVHYDNIYHISEPLVMHLILTAHCGRVSTAVDHATARSELDATDACEISAPQ